MVVLQKAGAHKSGLAQQPPTCRRPMRRAVNTLAGDGPNTILSYFVTLPKEIRKDAVFSWVLPIDWSADEHCRMSRESERMKNYIELYSDFCLHGGSVVLSRQFAKSAYGQRRLSSTARLKNINFLNNQKL